MSTEAMSRSQAVGRRQTALRLLVGICLVAGYVLSEWRLRDSTYGEPKVSSSADWKPIVDKLPLLLRDPIERYLKAEDIEARLPVAKTDKEKLKLLYELAPLRGSMEREQVLKRIVREFPENPEAAPAWNQLIRDGSQEYTLVKYVDFCKSCKEADGKTHPGIWVIGWGLAQARDGAAQRQFLLALADSETVGAGLVDPYEELVNIAIHDDDDELLKRADKLLKPSRALWQKEQERLNR